MEVRYADVAEELVRDWGHIFQPGGDDVTYRAAEYPGAPYRVLPSDFRAYLEGAADSYDAPYLPDELHAFRQQTQAASGMRPA